MSPMVTFCAWDSSVPASRWSPGLSPPIHSPCSLPSGQPTPSSFQSPLLEGEVTEDKSFCKRTRNTEHPSGCEGSPLSTSGFPPSRDANQPQAGGRAGDSLAATPVQTYSISASRCPDFFSARARTWELGTNLKKKSLGLWHWSSQLKFY